MDIIPGQTWQHYKGGIYKVVMLALRESDAVECVIYQGENQVCWVRPTMEFLSKFRSVSEARSHED